MSAQGGANVSNTNVGANLGNGRYRTQNPEGVALNIKRVSSFPSLSCFAVSQPLPRVARCFAVAHSAPPWADIRPPLRGFLLTEGPQFPGIPCATIATFKGLGLSTNLRVAMNRSQHEN